MIGIQSIIAVRGVMVLGLPAGEPARRRLDAADACARGDGDAHKAGLTPLTPERVPHQPIRRECVLLMQIVIWDHFSAVPNYLERVIVGLT